MKKRLSRIDEQKNVEDSEKTAEASDFPVLNKKVLRALRRKLVVDDGNQSWGKLQDFRLNTLRGLTFDQAILRYPQLLNIMEDVLAQVSSVIPTELQAEIRQEKDADQDAYEFAKLLKSAGKWFSRNGHKDLALKAFEGAMKFLSEDGDLYVASGDIYFEMENNREAIRSYEEALLRLPGDMAVRRKLADVRIRMAEVVAYNPEMAVKYYEAVLEDFPDYVPALCGMADISFFNDDFHTAEKYYVYALDSDPSCCRALVGLGNIHSIRHQDDEAEELYGEALLKNPFYLPGLYDMADFQFRSRENNLLAKSYINRAMALKPGDTAVMMLKAEIAMELEDFDTAKEMVELVLRQDSANKKAYEVYCRLVNGECFMPAEYGSSFKALKPDQQQLSRDFHFSLQYLLDPKDEVEWEKYLIQVAKDQGDKFEKFKSKYDNWLLN